MDFFEHQDRALRKTFRLVILYAAVVAALAALMYILAVAIIGATPAGAEYLGDRLWDPWLCAWTTWFTLATILIGNIYKCAQLRDGGASIARMLGGHLIVPGDCRADERMLLNVVEEMAIASSTPVPPVYLLDEEEGINAFAAGYGPNDAVIAVSRGALQYLSRDELQGVIAHEFSHLLNGDMRLNLRLIGILHGILLIAYFGDGVLRVAYEGARYWGNPGGQRGRRDTGELIGVMGWELVLVVLGVSLQMIGFIGAFFGSLIKSGVSWQREFLADASAVQFTRNPEGVAGALKKIGGLDRGSRLRARGAAQASHLFFSSGVDASMINLFPTHPRLKDRIRRIDPNWDGAFPDNVMPQGLPRVPLSTEEFAPGGRAYRPPDKPLAAATLPQPLQTAALLASAWQVTQDRPEETVEASAALEQVGTPGPEHLAHAAALLAGMPDALRTAVEEPLGAQAVVFLLLLSDDPPVREKQLRLLSEPPLPGLMQQIEALTPVVRAVSTAARLPLVEIATPALRLLSDRQYRDFRQRLQQLVDADEQVSYFEFALLRSLRRQLAAQFEGARPARVRYKTVEPLLPACSQLLSILAHVGSDDEKGALQAFAQAADALSPGGGMRLHDRYYVSVRRADIALEELAQADPLLKRKVLAACTACVTHDGKVTLEEAELLRAIADSLDCPVPPILASLKLEQET